MRTKRKLAAATKTLSELTQLLEEKVSAFECVVRTCTAGGDPNVAVFVSHLHTFVFYRKLVQDALRVLHEPDSTEEK